ncbi:MAG: hypothetical protein HPY66_3168 [Firmicutes bacterium]|nr:hypothetical protein [Bacillota bacterium]MDI6707402.1 DUF3189 family protein [Bacillota bacterium]
MHIIYHCVGGTHSSAIASALHLGMLPSDRTATTQELLSIPYFDTITRSEYGSIIPRGIDEYGNSIYTLSRQFYPQIVIKALEDLSIILTGNDTEVIFVNAGSAVNTMMKIGGFLSRRINLVSIGRPIVIKGSQKAYMALVDIVHETKDRIKSMKE